MAHSPASSSTPVTEDKRYEMADGKDTDKAPFESTSASEDSSSEAESLDLAKNPFLDPEVAAYWRQVYDDAQYECRHAFDPTLTWTEEEEKRVVRKLDWRICTWAVCITLALTISCFVSASTYLPRSAQG
jgi:hypothetical protein